MPKPLRDYSTELLQRLKQLCQDRNTEEYKKWIEKRDSIVVYEQPELYCKLKEYYDANSDVKIKNILNNISNDLNIGDLKGE